MNDRISACVFDITAYGARGDGVSLCTDAVQRAIDTCSAAGGGTVLVPRGEFVIGTIRLKDGVTLSVSAAGKLLGSTDIADYATDTHRNMYIGEPHMDRCLIFARGCRNIGITGGGTIDGRGGREHFPNPGDPNRYRPMLIRFVDCSHIRLRDIALVNPAAWTVAMLYCDDIGVEGIRISSRANHNGDGLDFDGCHNVRVANGTFDNSDDSICLQTSRADRPCRNIVVTNCIFTTRWAGMRIGLLSRGDFENVAVSNCVFHDIEDSGLKIQLCEGGSMRGFVFSNLVMENVPRPVFMTFNRQRACVDPPDGTVPAGEMSGFLFDNIRIRSGASAKSPADHCIVISGHPGRIIRDVSFNGISCTSAGGGTTADAENADLAEFDEVGLESKTVRWPEYVRLGATVPAFGLYARHVEGLSLRGSRFDTALPDARPAVVCDDVHGLDIDGLTIRSSPGSVCGIRLRNTGDGFIHGCRFTGGDGPFLQVEGEDGGIETAANCPARETRRTESHE